MKKLLLALLILIGSVLPSMANRCNDGHHEWFYYDWENMLEDFVYDNDLECIKYYVDRAGMDRINENAELSANLFRKILRHSNFEVFAFMIDNGLTDKYIEKRMFDMYLVSDSQPGDPERFYNSLDFKKFEFLLNKRNIWGKISDSAIELFISWICIDDLKDTSFIEFLINSGMPESEYDRYIKKTKEIMADLEYTTTPYVKSYEKILEQNRKYEIAKQILALFEKAKIAKYQKVNENIGQILSGITEEKMQQWEQQYNQ
ncbi:MAG: hypothetical protein J5594_01640 [Elusimicrobiaceae bacterium]|nr:hypothetical protein [Elusimicrobiaceae bacterium]